MRTRMTKLNSVTEQLQVGAHSANALCCACLRARSVWPAQARLVLLVR